MVKGAKGNNDHPPDNQLPIPNYNLTSTKALRAKVKGHLKGLKAKVAVAVTTYAANA
jgi:hypothetical protein